MEAGNALLDEHALALTGVDCPRVCFLPTASGAPRKRVTSSVSVTSASSGATWYARAVGRELKDYQERAAQVLRLAPTSRNVVGNCVCTRTADRTIARIRFGGPETQNRRQCRALACPRRHFEHGRAEICAHHGNNGIAGAEIDTNGNGLHGRSPGINGRPL